MKLKEVWLAIKIVSSRIVFGTFCLFIVWQCTLLQNDSSYWLLILPILPLADDAYLFYKKEKKAIQEKDYEKLEKYANCQEKKKQNRYKIC